MTALTSLAYLVPLCVPRFASDLRPDVNPDSAAVAVAHSDRIEMPLAVSTLPEMVPEACRRIDSPRGGLIAAGITPESLAAAGVDPNQAAGVLAMAQVEWLARGQTISSAVQACGVASAEIARLSDLALRGLATPEQADAIGHARDERDATRTARDEAFDGFFSIITSGLTEDQRDALIRIKQNKWSALPLEYRVLNIDGNQAGILRGQLAAERIAADRGESVELRLEITVGEQDRAALAAADLAFNLDAIQAVWDAAVGR